MDIESRIEEFLNDLDNIDEEIWNLVTEQEKFKIYVKSQQLGESYEAITYATIDNVTPEVYADFTADLNFRKEWDPYLADIQYIEGSDHVYKESIFPWPLWNREYVFTSKRQDIEINGKPCIMLISQSVKSDIPSKPSTVRCDEMWSILLISSNNDDDNSTKIIHQTSDNPKFLTPGWLTEWAFTAAVENGWSAMLDGLEMFKERQTIQLS